ncbi:hypothetical protein AC578_8094 [Pseudocercospora eumusae]|uniref:Uncharacterized protein n=1 Tax=Pseudocercospora eumusae TaxID=321146 RepID=A0A139H0G9_9PEZI|nr:hypothetical protein AC578_8094 [Pseudocercospora eumusae]
MQTQLIFTKKKYIYIFLAAWLAMAPKLSTFRTRHVINISQSHLSSPRTIPESQNACAPAGSQHAAAALRGAQPDQTKERPQMSPAASVATTRVEDSYKDDAPVANGSIVPADQPRKPDDETLLSSTPEQKHKSRTLVTNANEESALAGSAESRTSRHIPGATSQTSAPSTLVPSQIKEHHEMAGAKAADLLRARQPNAAYTSAPVSKAAAQDTRLAQTKTSRAAGAPVKVSKTNVIGKSGAVSQKAAASAAQKSAGSSTHRGTPAQAPAPAKSKGRADGAPTPAPKATAKTRMLAETPAVSNIKTNATAKPEAQHDGKPATRLRGGKKRETVGPDTMQAKSANEPFHFGSENVAGSDYDIPISSPKGKAQRKGKRQGLLEPSQVKAQTSIVHDSIAAGKLPKVSSSQVRAAEPQAKSTKKHVKGGTQRRKAKVSSELELAKYSDADISAGHDPAPIETLSNNARALSAANLAAPERKHQHDTQLPDRPVEIQDGDNALKVLGSRQNPQILSEGSSSSSLPTDPTKKILKSGSAVEAKDLKTPTAFRSSPPLRDHTIAEDPTGLEQQTARSHKTTIIAFDKSGPRNQGKLPMATPGSKSARSSMPPIKDHRSANKTSGRTNVTSKRRSKQPSPTGMSTRVRKAQASNSSENVGDALQVVLGRRVNTASQSVGVLATRHPLSASSNHSNEEALAGKQEPNQEDEFVDMNDYDDAGDLRPSQRHPSVPEHQEPKTQLNRSAASAKDSTHEEDIDNPIAVHRDDDEGRHLREAKAARSVKDVKPMALSTDRHATEHTHRPSQAVSESVGNAIKEVPCEDQKPKPTEKKAKSSPSHTSGNHDSGGDAQVGSTLATSVKSRPIAHVSKQKDQPAIRHHPALESSWKKMPPPPPRTKGATMTTATRNSAAPIEKTAASSRPKRGIAADLPSEPAPKRVKPSATVEQPSQGFRNEATPRHSPKNQARTRSDAHAVAQGKRLPKRSLRQASQGSQTVDIHGSPVPRDMEIAETKTVLETFSQQASTSSDRAQNWQKDRNKQTPYRDDSDSSEEDPFVAPPSHQQKVMSSNTKPVPAEPEAESTAFSRVKVTEAQSRMLYGETEAVEDIASPLNSEERDNDNSESEESIPSFAKLVRNFNDYIHDHMKVQSKKSSKNKRSPGTPSGYAVRRAKKPTPPSADLRPTGIRKKRDAQPGVFAGRIIRSPYKASVYTAPAAEEEDPDKTLVNAEDSTPETYLQKSPHHAAVSPDSEANSEDLVEWTGLLKSHQRSFFDGLVKCAQSLTNHMVREENATEQMLEEYRRRELYLIQQEEKRQDKHYQDLLVMCQEKRKARNARLLSMSKDMHGLAEDFKHDMHEYKTRRAGHRKYNYELEAYIEGL